MCQILIVHERACTNIGEMEFALGGAPVLDEGYGEVAANHCLCSVDIAATASKFGLVTYYDPADERWEPLRLGHPQRLSPTPGGSQS